MFLLLRRLGGDDYALRVGHLDPVARSDAFEVLPVRDLPRLGQTGGSHDGERRHVWVNRLDGDGGRFLHGDDTAGSVLEPLGD